LSINEALEKDKAVVLSLRVNNLVSRLGVNCLVPLERAVAEGGVVLNDGWQVASALLAQALAKFFLLLDLFGVLDELFLLGSEIVILATGFDRLLD